MDASVCIGVANKPRGALSKATCAAREGDLLAAEVLGIVTGSRSTTVDTETIIGVIAEAAKADGIGIGAGSVRIAGLAGGVIDGRGLTDAFIAGVEGRTRDLVGAALFTTSAFAFDTDLIGRTANSVAGKGRIASASGTGEVFGAGSSGAAGIALFDAGKDPFVGFKALFFCTAAGACRVAEARATSLLFPQGADQIALTRGVRIAGIAALPAVVSRYTSAFVAVDLTADLRPVALGLKDDARNLAEVFFRDVIGQTGKAIAARVVVIAGFAFLGTVIDNTTAFFAKRCCGGTRTIGACFTTIGGATDPAQATRRSGIGAILIFQTIDACGKTTLELTDGAGRITAIGILFALGSTCVAFAAGLGGIGTIVIALAFGARLTTVAATTFGGRAIAIHLAGGILATLGCALAAPTTATIGILRAHNLHTTAFLGVALL